MKRYSVYGVGNALVDTEVQVADHELEQLGVDKGVMTLVDEAHQQSLANQLQGHLGTATRASGGSAANSIIAIARFGGQSFYSCKVANDDNGDFYLQDLEAAGVDHNWQRARDNGTTGRCLVLVSPDAERSMLTNLAISETMSAAELEPLAIQNSEFLYIEGYLVTSPSSLAAAVEARRVARQAGVKVSLSFSDPGMVAFFNEEMREILGGEPIELLFCNEAEAKQWAGTDNLNATVESLRQVARSFAITLGGEGALVFDGGKTIKIDPTAVAAIDTNGAGDMFAGAFLYAITAGHSYATAGRFASLAASRVVSRFGPRLSASEHNHLFEEFFGR